MAGLHLRQLHTACLNLKASLDAALATNGLAPLTAMVGEPAPVTQRPKHPVMVVSFAGERGRVEETISNPPTWAETVPVQFEMTIRGEELDALGYEGTAADVLRDALSTLNAAVTDATVREWTTAGGSAAMSEDVVNRDSWTVTLYFDAVLEW